MTRAGEKLYAEPEQADGSLVRALFRDRQLRRGFRHVAAVFVGLLALGLG